MRFTIERMRALVLAAGVLLVAALGVFLAVGKWKSLLSARDIPRRLGIDIEERANGVTYTESHGGHTLFKIHASNVTQLKDSHALLHNVFIELYGEDGQSANSIKGNDFEYDPRTGIATAQGPVEITLVRPGAALTASRQTSASRAPGGKAAANTLATAAHSAANGNVQVQTSGLVFDQKTGVARTIQKAEFSMAQGSGSSVGADYDSHQGYLVLDHAVELTTERGGQPVVIHARHAEFQRGTQLCQLAGATADYRGGQATAGLAKIFFRDDGSARHLDALNGFTLETATGGHVAAPSASLDFGEHNLLRHGHLEGGVLLDSANAGRQMHGTAPAAELDFTPQGELRLIQLNQGVEMESETETQGSGSKGPLLQVSRTWRSPVADVEFRDAGHGQVEPAVIHGSGGVVVTSETRRGNQAPVPSRLAADAVTGEFGPGSVLNAITGVGHASVEETTVQGARETATGERLEAQLEPAAAARGGKPGRSDGAQTQVQSAVLDGHVILVEEPAPKPHAEPEPPLRATAGRAVYGDEGESVELTQSPRVQNGGLDLAADRIDLSQQSGDAFAHGNVKATWMDSNTGASAPSGRPAGTGGDVPALGASGPAHIVAEEAKLNRAKDEATFSGRARLWQQANSVAAPTIVLNRRQKTLVALSSNLADPVRAVLLSEGGTAEIVKPGKESAGNTQKRAAGNSSQPSVIRVRGGELTYSDSSHQAVMVSGAFGSVIAQTGDAVCTSERAVLDLQPRDTPSGKKTEGQGQVERMTATGHVVITSEGRRGTGEELVYTGKTGDYVLTGTPSSPPRLTDPSHGTVTGAALIFNSRDDSVSIEGGGHETRTETTAPR